MRLLGLTMTVVLAFALIGCGNEDGGEGTDKTGKDGKGRKASSREAKDDTFVKIMDSIDLNVSENTTLNVNTAWEKLKGQEVKWQMEVVDVKGSRDRVEIYAKKNGKPLHRGYNIIVTTYDQAKADALKKGDTVTIRGMFSNRRQRGKGRPLLIYIGSAQILD